MKKCDECGCQKIVRNYDEKRFVFVGVKSELPFRMSFFHIAELIFSYDIDASTYKQ